MDVRQRWSYGTIMAVAFGVSFGVFSTIGRDTTVGAGVATGLVAGAVFGTGMTWVADRAVRRLTEGVRDGLTPAELKQTLVVSVRGPIPQEARVLAAAAELARRRLEMVRRRRSVDRAARIVLIVLAAVLGVVLNPIWWIAAGLLALSGLLVARQVRKLRERAAVLTAVCSAIGLGPAVGGSAGAGEVESIDRDGAEPDARN